jgi:hypothetical protein
MNNRRLLVILIPVIVALIAAISSIVVAYMNKDNSEVKDIASSATISISNDVRDINGNPIAMNSAPFEIKVSGTVSNADGLFVYLIVANPYDHYVQPGLGPNVDGEFTISGYLGVKGIKDGLQYTVYAVVTDKPYVKQASFKGESFIAKSKEIMLTRESLPAPAP